MKNFKNMITFFIIAIFLIVGVSLYYNTEKKPVVNFQSLYTTPAVISPKTQPNISSTMENQPLPNFGHAPEFIGINNWLNSNPLTLEDVKGKVVLVDFWTYTCINCIHTLPYVAKWYDTYHDKGFVVVGIHTPEFAYEKETANVKKAIAQYGIHYPVGQDNEYLTWNNYSNQYWPAMYLVDKQGTIIYEHFGEGNYEETESMIQKLLAQ